MLQIVCDGCGMTLAKRTCIVQIMDQYGGVGLHRDYCPLCQPKILPDITEVIHANKYAKLNITVEVDPSAFGIVVKA